jgi:DNA polymerase zeta
MYYRPVLLFDFQSLYPSVMIAYNICYSTCLGNINNLFDRNRGKKLGVAEKMNIDLNFIEEL